MIKGIAKLAETTRVFITDFTKPFMKKWEASVDRQIMLKEAEAREKAKDIGAIYGVDRPFKVAQRQAELIDEWISGKNIPENLRPHLSSAAKRVAYKELRREANILKIIDKAASLVPEAVTEKPVDEDWVYHFFNYCQDISDDQMQVIWAKILAGEVTQPGKFSPRALNFIRHMIKEEAKLFTNYCSYLFAVSVFRRPGSIIHARLCSFADTLNNYLKEKHLGWGHINHLVSIGLVDSMGGLKFEKGKPIQLNYSEHSWKVSFGPKQKSDFVAAELLTTLGEEIYPIAGAEHGREWAELVINTIKRQGFDVELVS